MNSDAKSTKKRAAFAVVLSFPAFRNLWLGQICSMLAVNMTIFVLALRIYQATGSNAAVSALFLSFGVPAVLFGMVAGAVVDHLDKRSVLIFCDIARAIIVLGLYALSDAIAPIYLVALFNGVITQFYVPSLAPTIPRLVPEHRLLTANSLFSFTYYSSMALGFILAGPLLRFAGPHISFLVISVLFLVAAWMIHYIPAQGEKLTHIWRVLRLSLPLMLTKVVKDLYAGIRYVLGTPPLFEAVLLLTGTQVVLAILGTLGPGFADRVLEIDVRDASLVVLGPAVLGILVGALWVGHGGTRFRRSHLVNTGITMAGMILVLVSLLVRLERETRLSWFFTKSTVLPLGLLLFFFFGVANSLLDVPANSTLQKASTGAMRGHVYGILTAAVGGVGILPVVAGGILADSLGVGKVILLLGVIILAYGLYRVRYNTTAF